MRTRNSGLLQGAGMFWIVPKNSASPCAFSGTLAVFAVIDVPGVFWVASMALHTSVPITSVIGRIRPASNFAATVGGGEPTIHCRVSNDASAPKD
jgi:hypothetical protein